MTQGEEKTEAPSDHKLREARNKGQVAKSADVVTLVSLAFAIGFLGFFIPSILNKNIVFIREIYSQNFNQLSPSSIKNMLNSGFFNWFMLSMPILIVAGLGAVIGNVGQFGFLLTSHPIKLDLKRLNPINGLKKMMSKDRMVELIKQMLKFSLVFWVILTAIKPRIFSLILLFRADLNAALNIMSDTVMSICIRVLLCFLVIAVADFFWQRYSFLKSMRMSKYELKKEYYQQEGDPHIKQERKRVHQETLEKSPPDLSQASVVITNPAHLAVAIKYDDNLDQVPIIISKARGKRALELINQARKYELPIIRNVPLARDLQWLEINEEIPENLYHSVAEVLSFIQELKY